MGAGVAADHVVVGVVVVQEVRGRVGVGDRRGGVAEVVGGRGGRRRRRRALLLLARVHCNTTRKRARSETNSTKSGAVNRFLHEST